MILAREEGSKVMENVIFSHFWGVRFRGCILEGILDDFCMRKPFKYIQKTMVFKLFQLFEKVQTNTQKTSPKGLGNH